MLVGSTGQLVRSSAVFLTPGIPKSDQISLSSYSVLLTTHAHHRQPNRPDTASIFITGGVHTKLQEHTEHGLYNDDLMHVMKL